MQYIASYTQDEEEDDEPEKEEEDQAEEAEDQKEEPGQEEEERNQEEEILRKGITQIENYYNDKKSLSSIDGAIIQGDEDLLTFASNAETEVVEDLDEVVQMQNFNNPIKSINETDRSSKLV
ncbi:hypothetical protein FQR65_LT11717 [Abscondita terminalis]|nr:hypothetical protein FQR65_LT11717 [Abscondita terminalis]